MWSENEGALRPSTVLKENRPIQPQPCAITACRQDKPCASFEKHVKLQRSNGESRCGVIFRQLGRPMHCKGSILGKEDYDCSKSENRRNALD